ncbi:serine--tRNA ligase [Rhizorhapis sp. SPR117]|uniref:serine--tRNA ligase n=1 Tax=Rhizorhapis sp. SPR117 TaxID=2912611 RepID=UPI001F010BF0|nr:serine--tRNA ligase [Rhizorhapis sp. SPR117]
MHDIRLIRENPAAFDAALKRRGTFSIDPILNIDTQLRGYLQERERHLADRNVKSREIGEYKRRGEPVPENLLSEIKYIKDRLAILTDNPNQNPESLQKQRDELLATIPNLPADDVPDGTDENDNVELVRWGEPRAFDFTPQDHADFGPALGLDFEAAAAMSGARFTALRGQMARLHRALAQFMLDRQTGENGYEEVNPPLLVREEALFGTGQLPKFAEDLFLTSLTSTERFRSILEENLSEFSDAQMPAVRREELILDVLKWFRDRDGRWLIPTAEVSLTNLVREQIVPDASLPLRFTALTPCFRSEAGSAGRDTRGFIRQHQFEKVELVAICRPEESETEHQKMCAAAEGILQALNLPYRRVLLCTGDMGFSARKTFDLEVWLPSQQTYREISSISQCGDFQARRMNARYKPEGEKTTRFLHTLNGSGLAVGRTLVAVLENYQQADGSVIVPEVLAPYMGGITKLEPVTK